MEDVIQVENRFYILATSSLADDRTRVLKHGETFAVANRLGDFGGLGLGEQGLYHRGTRYLSRFLLRMGDRSPQLLRSTVRDDNAFLTLEMMNPDVHEDGRLNLARGSLHIFRSKFLWEGVCYDRLRCSNFSLHSIQTVIHLQFAADYADIFEVRGTRREASGELQKPLIEDDCITLSYVGRDRQLRRTRLEFAPRPTALTGDTASFSISLGPREETSVSINAICDDHVSERKVFDFDRSMSDAIESIEQAKSRCSSVASSNPFFDRWMSRSEADLQIMISGNPEEAYPYAGVPWYSTVFGRDGIITAMECLWAAPWIGAGVLRYLAQTQATEVVPEQEAEPGKIVHEMRHSEMANLREVPFGCYYGTVDATPLFVMLAGAYFDRTGDLALLKDIWPNVLAALDWMDTYGDPDRDGFVEYLAKAEKGLVHQGWKDSHDSIFLSDGSLAQSPIALCEVQGYVYAAKQAAARVAAHLGHRELSQRLAAQAKSLQEKFENTFWDDGLNTYVLALDGKKKPCRVLSSNAGHCLFTGICGPERAARLATSLLSEQLYCGWGIRTLGSQEIRYNPMSYHNGSVWPHDNAIIAKGLARYGYKREAARIFTGMFDASMFMDLNRLPELFCGFHKRSGAEGPTLYPVACSPQAWASGSLYLFLEASLGIHIQGHKGPIEFNAPYMPDFLDQVRFSNLRIGDATVDLLLRREKHEIALEVLRNPQGLKVQITQSETKDHPVQV